MTELTELSNEYLVDRLIDYSKNGHSECHAVATEIKRRLAFEKDILITITKELLKAKYAGIMEDENIPTHIIINPDLVSVLLRNYPKKPVMSETEFQKFIEKILAGTSWHRKSIFVTGKIEHIRRFLLDYIDIKEIDTEQNK